MNPYFIECMGLGFIKTVKTGSDIWIIIDYVSSINDSSITRGLNRGL